MRKKLPETWVFWIHASSAARFDQDVTDLVNELKLPGRSATTSEHLALLAGWLRGNSKRRWLIVLDNVDDAQFLVGPTTNREGRPSKSRKSYLPHCSHGQVLITSRNRSAALQMVPYESLRHVEPMDSNDAVQLLENRLAVSGSRSDITLLAETLSFMPLALTQAAAYINHRSTTCSVAQYLARLNLDKESQIRLLTCDEGDSYRDSEAQRSIILAWNISFDHISQARPSAARLLSLMSFFDRQAIQRFLFQIEREEPVVTPQPSTSKATESASQASHNRFDNGGSTADEDSANDKRVDQEEFDDNITTLMDFSFVSATMDADVFEMHRLVQDASKYWLSRRPELLGRLEVNFIDTLVQKFPKTSDSLNWPMCRMLYPHVKAAMSVKPQDRNSTVGLGHLLENCGYFAGLQSKWKDCASMLQLSLDLLDRPGVDSERLWYVRSTLANCKSRLGLWDEALSIQKQMYDMDAEHFGHNHQRTLDNRIDIAAVYYDQTRFADAERTLLDTLRVCENSLGARDPTTLRCKTILAKTYTAMGNHAKAETLSRDVVQACTDVSGDLHWRKASALDLLAKALYRMRRLEESEKVCEQALEAYTELYGQGDPMTLLIKHDLAETRRDLGLHQSAIGIMSDCVLLSESSFGTDDPRTIERRNTLSEWKESYGEAQTQAEHHLSQHSGAPTRTPSDTPDEESSSSRSPADQRSSHAKVDESLRKIFSRLLRRRRG